MIEIHGRFRPKFKVQFFPCYQHSWFFQQHGQQLEWLLLQSDALAKPRQFAGSKISFENSKFQIPGRYLSLLHDGSSGCMELGTARAPVRRFGTSYSAEVAPNRNQTIRELY